jgi:hypothetical protein
MTPHSLMFLLHVLLIAIALFLPPMDPLFLFLNRALFPLTLFMSPIFLLFLISPYSLCLLGRSLTMTIVLFLIMMFAIFRIIALITWLAPAPVVMIHSVFGSLTDFILLPLHPPISSALPMLLHPRHRLLVALSFGSSLWISVVCFATSRSFRVNFRSRVFRSLSELSIGKASSASLSL